MRTTRSDVSISVVQRSFGPVRGLTVDICEDSGVLVHVADSPPLPSEWDAAVLWAYAHGWQPGLDGPDFRRNGLFFHLLRRVNPN